MSVRQRHLMLVYYIVESNEQDVVTIRRKKLIFFVIGNSGNVLITCATTVYVGIFFGLITKKGQKIDFY